METTALAKWNKDKLIQEILKLRESKRTSLNSSLQQCEIDDFRKDVELYKGKAAIIEQENKELRAALDNEKRLYDQSTSEIIYLRAQNDKVLTKIIDGIVDNERKASESASKKFFPNFVSRFAKNLVISDSTFKFVKQSDISNETAIYSYPSATTNDVNSTIDSYSTGTKSESLIFHLGHNTIDQGTDGKKAAEQIVDLVGKCITKFKPHKVAICKIPDVKNGLYGRDVNNKEINEYNKEVDSIADQLNGEFQSCKVNVLNYDLENTDIRHDGVHPNLHGINKIVATLRNHLKRIGYNCSTNDVSLRHIPPKRKDLFVPMRDGWNNFNNRIEF